MVHTTAGDDREVDHAVAAVLDGLDNVCKEMGACDTELLMRFTYFLHGATSKMVSRFSKLTPRLSGRSAKDTKTVKRVHVPNKK